MFSDFWTVYPRKVAKKAAEKAYLKARKDVPHAAIMASLNIFLETEWRGRPIDKIPHPASWLNREEFEEEVPPMLNQESYEIQSGAESVPEKPRSHEHWCNRCKPAHAWDCFEGLCIWPGHFVCQEAARGENLKESGAKTKKALVGAN